MGAVSSGPAQTSAHSFAPAEQALIGSTAASPGMGASRLAAPTLLLVRIKSHFRSIQEFVFNNIDYPDWDDCPASAHGPHHPPQRPRPRPPDRRPRTQTPDRRMNPLLVKPSGRTPGSGGLGSIAQLRPCRQSLVARPRTLAHGSRVTPISPGDECRLHTALRSF